MEPKLVKPIPNGVIINELDILQVKAGRAGLRQEMWLSEKQLWLGRQGRRGGVRAAAARGP